MNTVPRTPSLKIDAEMATRYGHKLDLRQKNERRIAWQLMHHLAASGFRVIGVDDGDEMEKLATPTAAMELIFNLDESRVVFRRPGYKSHVVLLILGNGSDGFDMISDWSYSEGDPDGFDAAMNVFVRGLDPDNAEVR